MFDLVHQMRTRVITSPSFTGDRILGAILFEDTMDRDIEGQPTADYLLNVKRIVPFLKVDKGLQPEKDGVQLMKPMPELAALLDKAKTKHIFGTKMRSVIQRADPAGIQNIVQQQFEVAGRIINTGLVPIIEPEVDIHCPEKARAEVLLKAAILEKLGRLPAGQHVRRPRKKLRPGTMGEVAEHAGLIRDTMSCAVTRQPWTKETSDVDQGDTNRDDDQ